MAWFDIAAGMLVVLIVWLESQRGFGRALFDLLGGIIAMKVSTALAPPLGEAAPVLSTEGTNEAFWLATIFVILAVLVVIASKFIYQTTLLSLDVLDPVVGWLLGLVSAFVVVHVLLRMLLAAYGGGEAAEVLLSSFAGQELIEFRTYNIVVTALRNLGKW